MENTVELTLEAMRRGYLEMDGIERRESITEETIVTERIIQLAKQQP